MGGRIAVAATQFMQFLEQRQGDVSTAELAAFFELSPRQARAVFHRMAGESFRLAQVRARLQPARPRVQEGKESIAEIAYRFGYSRRTKFDQSYVRVFAITPAADRASSRAARTRDTATQGVDACARTVYVAAQSNPPSEGL